MRTIKLTLAYDGSAYHGFQKQPHGNTIQNVLEEFLGKVCGETIVTAGSGRTDAGVHALEQVVSFSTSGRIPCANIVRASKTMLPQDLVLLKAEEVEPDFHARYSALWKQYGYKIVVNKVPSPFLVRYAWQMRERPNVELMNEACELLLGKHDFSAFRSSGSVDSEPVRTIYKAIWKEGSKGDLHFSIAGDGFLYHMVRNLVWSLVQIGLGERTVEEFGQELNSKRCQYLNSPAPACGLYLEHVEYTNPTTSTI